MANYSSIDTQAIQIEHMDSEITINLHPTNPTIDVKNSSYISGVYDTNGNLNPNPPICSVDTYNSTILNNTKTISATAGNEITLKLNTKYMEI